MSATTADTPFERGESRFAKLRRQTAAKARAARDKTGRVIKKGASLLWRGIKATGRGSKKVVVTTGVGAYRGIGWLGLGVSWLLRTASNAVMAVFALAAVLIVGLFTAVAGGLLWMVAAIHQLWVVYIHGTFAYMARRPMGIKYRDYITLRKDMLKSRTERWMSNSNDFLTKKWRERVTDVLVDTDDIVIPEGHIPEGAQLREDKQDPDNDPYLVPRFDQPAPQSLEDKVQLQVQEDLQHPGIAFGGHPFTIGDDTTEVYNHPGTTFTLGNDLERFVAENGGDMVSLNYADFVKKPEYVEFLKIMKERTADTGTAQECAYWTGRLEVMEMLPRFKETTWKDHGRTWTLIYQRYNTKKATYPMAYLRAGVKDQTEELAQANAKVSR